jgi:hypothetical protein
MVSYDEFAQFIDEYAEAKNQEGSYRIMDFSLRPVRAWRFTRNDFFTLVHLVQSSTDGPGGIEIVGAGAWKLPVDGDMFGYVARQATRYIYGGPLASVRNDGTVLTAARMRVPFNIVRLDDTAILSYIFGMIDVVGRGARQVADTVIKYGGGQLLNGFDEDDCAELYATALGR